MEAPADRELRNRRALPDSLTTPNGLASEPCVRRASVLAMATLLSACAAPGTQQTPESKSTPRDPPLYVHMTDEDLHLANQAVQNALEFGVSDTLSTWNNLADSSWGAIKPLRTWRTQGGSYCREYEEQLRIGERSERYVDVACRNPDGIWLPAP